MNVLRKDVSARLASSGPRLTPARPGPLPLVQTRPITQTVPRKITLAEAAPGHVSAPYKPFVDQQWLQSLVKKIPLVLDVAPPKTADPDQYFQLPLGTHFRAPSREIGWDMAKPFGHALREHGLAVIELGFEDPKSNFILEVIEAMGCSADSHSSTQGALWDVTYKPEGVVSAKSGGNAHSRSHGVGEFAWHTDGSFEEVPQRYFGLHIVQPDEMGGGIFRVLPAEELVKALGPEATHALLTTEFDIQVPDEFYKGKASNKGKLLDVDPVTGRHLLRFRRDILPDPPHESAAACRAVDKLNRLLDDPATKGWRFGDEVFKKNVVVLMDNARFLHMRTEIKDKRRLLRRVRFHNDPQ